MVGMWLGGGIIKGKTSEERLSTVSNRWRMFTKWERQARWDVWEREKNGGQVWEYK